MEAAQEQEKQLAESAAVALEGDKVKKARRRKKKGAAANSTPEGQNAKQSERSSPTSNAPPVEVNGIRYGTYQDESQMQAIMELFAKDLSEPYSIYTYRYFINNWPRLCVLAFDASSNRMVGSIVCKLDNHRGSYRGYIAMLAVEDGYRKKGIGSQLVTRAINTMKEDGCDEVVLETEVTNKGSLALYERLGFIKDKRLCRYYLNGVDAFRLKIFFLKDPVQPSE